MRVLQVEEPHQLKVGVGKPSTEFARQPVRQCFDNLFSIGGPVFAAQFLLDNAPANLEVGMDLNQIHAARHGGARSGDQLADAVEKRSVDLHNSPRIVRSTAALSASSAAISSIIACGLRCVTSSPPFGFFTDRSKVAASMLLASTVQDFGESARVFCNCTKSARSSSFSGLVLPRLRPGSSW